MNTNSKTNIKTPLPLGGAGGRLRVGVLGAAGYTGGELIRVLLGHPEAEIVFANSESNAGNLLSDVHEGLIGETDERFTAEMPFDQVDVVFFCFKIIDLAQDFRIKGDHDYVYVCQRSIRRTSRRHSMWLILAVLLQPYSWHCYLPPTSTY